MLTMQEIRSKSYRVFPDSFTQEQRTRQESSLKYIEHLAAISGNDISHWMPLEVFAKDGSIPKERNKLNQIFFDYLARDKAQKKEEAQKTPQELLTDQEAEAICFRFDQNFAKNFENSIARFSKDLQFKREEIARYAKEYQKKLERIAEAEAALRGLKVRRKEGTGVAGDLKCILSEQWWSLAKGTEGNISLITPAIRLTFINEGAKIATAVNVGQLLLEVSTPGASLAVKVLTYDGNPEVDGYYHPHVTGEGNICTGDMTDAYHEACNTFKLYDLAAIVKKVLTNYNDDSPYIELHELENAVKEGEVLIRGEEQAIYEEIRQAIAAVNFTEQALVPPPQAPATEEVPL